MKKQTKKAGLKIKTNVKAGSTKDREDPTNGGINYGALVTVRRVF